MLCSLISTGSLSYDYSRNIKGNSCGKRNPVFISGKGYGVTIGQIISAFRSPNLKTPKVIDGFVSRPSKLKPTESSRGQVKSSEVHKRTEKTRTLMRGGLKRPAGNQAAQTHTRTGQPSIGTQLRAKTISRHSKVEHFGNPMHSGHTGHSKKALSGEVINRGAPVAAGAAGAAAAAPLPSMIASASHQKLERMLDEALARADAHKEALRYHAAKHFWQRRWFSGPTRWFAVLAVISVLLGGAAYAWRTVPQLSLKVAAMRAHVSAAVPAYKPDGYSLAGPAKAMSGTVEVQFKSQEDQNKTYSITQQPSDFTSTMVSQTIVPKGAPVQTSQVDGNTVYIYGNSNDAAWVNNGVLYTIKNNSGLSSDQLLQIVSGLNP